MGARGKREAFSKRLWKTPLHVCTCSQPSPKRLSRPEFPAFSTIAAASIGHALQHKSDPTKRQENQFFQLLWQRWTSFWPRLPTPEQLKPFPVPQNERIGLDHDKGFLPVE